MRKFTIFLVTLLVLSIPTAFAQEATPTLAELVIQQTVQAAILEALATPTDAAFATAFDTLGVTPEEALANQNLLNLILVSAIGEIAEEHPEVADLVSDPVVQVTVFAPTNDAFLPEETLNAVQASADLLVVVEEGRFNVLTAAGMPVQVTVSDEGGAPTVFYSTVVSRAGDDSHAFYPSGWLTGIRRSFMRHFFP